MTGLSRWARARWGCRIQCPTVAAMTPISNRPASTHTTTANGRNPGTRTGRPAAAVATIEVPITDANQLGPTAASASRRSSRAARKPRPGERPSVGRRTVVVGAGEVAVTGRASAARPALDHPGSTDCGWPLARPSLISHPLADGAARGLRWTRAEAGRSGHGAAGIALAAVVPAGAPAISRRVLTSVRRGPPSFPYARPVAAAGPRPPRWSPGGSD